MYLNYHKTSVEIKELQKWNQLEKQEELVEHHVEERIQDKTHLQCSYMEGRINIMFCPHDSPFS